MEIKCPHCGQRNRVPASKLASLASCGKCGEPLLNSPVDADPGILSELISQSAVPVLIDFWAPWCGPCLAFAPTFKAMASKLGGKVVFVKMNTEAYQEAGQKFNIRAIPTLAAFFQDKELTRTTGALSASDLEKLVFQLIDQGSGK